jgi:hypothetical protein
MSSEKYLVISTDTTTSIFTGHGTLLRVVITQDVDSGTAAIKNTVGTTLFTCKTDYAGTFAFEIDFHAGISITTSGFTGGEMVVVYKKPN